MNNNGDRRVTKEIGLEIITVNDNKKVKWKCMST